MADNQEKVTRGIFYAFTRIILVVVAILVIALGFYTGMNSMNVNVIAKDAFTMREEDVLRPKTGYEADLHKLFTQDFVDSDPVLNSTKYSDYTIASYYQRADIKAQIVWPWTDKVVVHATEEVLDIIGTLKENSETAETAAAGTDQTQVTVKDKNPPEWVSGEYDVTLVKDPETSSWKVQEMKMTKEIQPAITGPSQEATESPLPDESVQQSTSGTKAEESSPGAQ